MPKDRTHKDKIIRDLGDNLILRQATPDDADALAEFNAKIHSDAGADQPNEHVGAWTRDLLEHPHPTLDPGDFTIVEDTGCGKIVSSLNLISQTWSYSGIPFGVGRPELVGTLPEYRNRGLIRAQFEVVHQWSDTRGEILQAITGIPYYYRQFGYEMGMDLGGGRVGYLPQLPKLVEGEVEKYNIRPAEISDLDFIAEVYRVGNRRYLVSCIRDKSIWHYELVGKSENNVNRYELRIIEDKQGNPIGYFTHPVTNWGSALVATGFEILPENSWAQVSPAVARYLFRTGSDYAKRDGKQNEFSAFGFWLGRQHPVYDVFKDGLPRVREPYAWYLRLTDIPAFLRLVRPALNERLQDSAFSGHSGMLKITFYRSGLKLTLENGNLTEIEPWIPTPQGHSGDAAFPDLSFLQLLFGYRSLDELKYAFADCWTDNDEAYGLINALFPKRTSDIWPLS